VCDLFPAMTDTEVEAFAAVIRARRTIADQPATEVAGTTSPAVIQALRTTSRPAIAVAGTTSPAA
jgi:hypothetical protein